jgi:hypothetical protein
LANIVRHDRIDRFRTVQLKLALDEVRAAGADRTVNDADMPIASLPVQDALAADRDAVAGELDALPGPAAMVFYVEHLSRLGLGLERVALDC